MKKITIMLILAISMQSCKQEKETFWKTENITKIDNQPFHGVTSAYMDMIAQMNIHLSIDNDEIQIAYPFEKKLKISEFKSFTNSRIPSTGELLDSIYDLSVSADTLKIKFYYNGTADKEKRFSLNLVKLQKEDYLAEVKQVKAQKSKTLNEVTTVDLSTFALVKKPGYLSEQTNLLQLNPTQLADELTDNKNSFQVTSITFSLSKNNSQLKYTTIGVLNSDKVGKHVAQISDIQFNNIEFVNNERTGEADAVIVSKAKMNNKEITTLYNFIAKNLASNNMEQFGLPRLYAEGDSLGIHNFLAVTWKTKDKVIKLAIEDVPDELWDQQIDGGIALRDNYSSKDIDQVFRHYLPLIGASTVKLFIVSNDLDQTLYSKENNPGSKTWGNMYDYTFKWRALSDIWENE